jgi:hypothetical protein
LVIEGTNTGNKLLGLAFSKSFDLVSDVKSKIINQIRRKLRVWIWTNLEIAV